MMERRVMDIVRNNLWILVVIGVIATIILWIKVYKENKDIPFILVIFTLCMIIGNFFTNLKDGPIDLYQVLFISIGEIMKNLAICLFLPYIIRTSNRKE
jgi:hypothetical protein